MIKHFSNRLILKDKTAMDISNSMIGLVEKIAAKTSQNFSVEHDARKFFTGTNLEGYEKDAHDFNEVFMRYCVEATGYEWDSIEMIKNPTIHNNRGFQDRFFSIINQVMTPVIPAVVSSVVMNLAEVKDIAMDDTATFFVESNELFQVNEASEGIMFGPEQRLYGEEFTVNPTMKEVTVGVDWYWVATGKMDWGTWAYKIGVSFGAYINKLIYKTLKDAVTSVPAAYKASGWSDSNHLGIAQRVKLANAGAQCYMFGTITALGSVLPSSDYFKPLLAEEWVKNGYLGSYKQVPIMEIDQVMVPTTVNTTATLGIDDDYLWYFPLGGYKPIKVVFGGMANTFQKDATQNFDKTQQLTIQRRFASKAITGSRYGYLVL